MNHAYVLADMLALQTLGKEEEGSLAVDAKVKVAAGTFSLTTRALLIRFTITLSIKGADLPKPLVL